MYNSPSACKYIGVHVYAQEQKRQEAYEEFLKEKLMIDEIVRKIYEEDQKYVPLNTKTDRQRNPSVIVHYIGNWKQGLKSGKQLNVILKSSRKNKKRLLMVMRVNVMSLFTCSGRSVNEW